MGTPPSFHQVSEFGEVVGEPWRLADRLLSGKTGSPKLVETVHSPSAPAGTATQTFPWAEPPLYSAPTSLDGSGMTPQLSSYVLLSDPTDLTAISKPALPVALFRG